MKIPGTPWKNMHQRPMTLEEMRRRHHCIARWIARGADHRAVANVMNMTEQQVALLAQDPAFKELCAHYVDNPGADIP